MSSISSIFGHTPSFLAGSLQTPGTHQEPAPQKRSAGRPKKWASEEERQRHKYESQKESGYYKRKSEFNRTYKDIAELDETNPMRSLLRHLEIIYKEQWHFPDTVENRQMLSEVIGKLQKTPKTPIQQSS